MNIGGIKVNLTNDDSSPIMGSLSNYSKHYNMDLHDFDIGKIEVERVASENYPKGWIFFDRIDSTKVRRVSPYLLSNMRGKYVFDSAPNCTLGPGQEIVGVYGYENDYGIANIGFIAKEAVQK